MKQVPVTVTSRVLCKHSNGERARKCLETLEEMNLTTHDEYGLKAGGLLHSLNKFSSLFGLRLSYLLFSAAEQVSFTLQCLEWCS